MLAQCENVASTQSLNETQQWFLVLTGKYFLATVSDSTKNFKVCFNAIYTTNKKID